MKKLFALIISSVLIFCGVIVALPVSVARAVESDFACNYSAFPVGGEYMSYGSTEVKTFSETEAAAANVPEGYENYVLKVINANANNSGILLDFSTKSVPLAIIDGLSVRVWLGVSSANTGTKPQIRITDPASVDDDWVYLPTAATPTGEWTTVEIPATNFGQISKNGYLHKFELALRSSAVIDFYIDSIALKLKENDGIGPVITCSADSLTWVENVPFQVEATAYDEREQRNVDVEYKFVDEGCLDAYGNMKKGVWNVKLVAKDYFGNVSEKDITVTVIEADKTPPVITTTPQTIYAAVGTTPMLKPRATDNSENVTVTEIWSQGAFDERGRLVAGSHVYTIIATDFSGNTAAFSIVVVVASDNGLGNDFIDEEALAQSGS